MSDKKLTKKQLNTFSSKFTQNIIKKSVKEATNKFPKIINCNDVKYNPCSKLNFYKTLKNINQKNFTTANKCCENDKYKLVSKYFNDKENTLKDLLKCLKNIYNIEKGKNKNFKLFLCGSSTKGLSDSKSFIEDYFPRDNSVGTSNFKRQHVFEALCKLILLFDYDNGYYSDSNSKKFYESLEDFNPAKKENEQDIDDILKTPINAGNSAGVVDIFFSKSKSKSKNEPTSPWSCERSFNKEIQSKRDEQEFILVQNKYYTNEFADVEKYDYSKILRKAKKLNNSHFNNFKIVLMVNNSKVLSDKINYEDESLEILENDKLEEWFNNFLIDLDKLDINTFIYSNVKKTNNSIQPRFHQELFIETTNEYLNKKGADNRKKFIWGAVPRSGKSFMIAGMISKRQKTHFNDIILILGAKTETQTQFLKIFKEDKYIDFEEYGVVFDDKKNSIKKSKNIYIFSQEKFKANKKDPLTKEESDILSNIKKQIKEKRVLSEETKKKFRELESKRNQIEYVLNDTTKKEYSELFKDGNKIDIYFDEIHSGGHTPKSREILKSFESENTSIELFVMVTATFAKPNAAYEEFMDKHAPIIIEWSYEDQQLMKNIDTNSVNIDIIKYNRNKNVQGKTGDIDNTEYDVLIRLLDEYNYKYGENYKQILAKQYAHHPELVLINPETLDDTTFNFADKDLTDYFFKLKCSAINYKSSNKDNLLKYDEIFHNKSHIDELLNLIGNYDDNDDGTQSLNEKCLYSILKNDFQFDIINSEIPKSQLWFLPTQNLYNEGKEKNTDEKCNPLFDESEKKGIKTAKYKVFLDDNEQNKSDSKPHIEPLTRGIALALSKEGTLFEKHFNVLIIHTNGDLYKLTRLDKQYNIKCVCYDKKGDKKKSIIDKIQDYENESKEKGKGLIILTGIILRLGVSLPCVDIALNFDNLQSVDLNYQTMFRVLTESANREKKFGYYVDFNKARTIKFVYDYNQVYSNILKKNNTIEDLSDAQQNILQLFNFNGLTFSKQKIKEKLKLYSSMVKDLKLDLDTLRKQYGSSVNEVIGKLILKISNPSDLYNLNKKLNIKFKKNKSTITINVEKGNKKKPAPKTEKGDENSESDNSTNETSDGTDEEINQLEIQRNMEVFLPGIVFMLAYFSEEYKCENLENCIDNAISDIERFIGDEFLCKCKSDSKTKDNYHLACYFNKFVSEKNKFKKDDFLPILIELKKILFDSEMYVSIRNALIIFYDNIRASFKLRLTGGSLQTSKKYEPLIFKIYQKDNTSEKENFNKWIEETIYKFLPIRDEAKDKHGEVFTPRALIDEMMNKLNEIDKSVFKDKTLKWLDPANGVGNFPLIVYGMLMKSLKSSITDDYERSQHILKDMLYMVELQEDNYEISRKLFGKDANIFCGSFLSEKDGEKPKWLGYFKDKSGKAIDTFDIIMGNPPYQQKNKYGETINSNKKLYADFIGVSLEVLNKNGYLLLLIPTNFFSGNNNKFYRDVIENEIRLINNNNITSNYFPNVGQEILYFIMKNKKIDKSKKINKFFTDVIFDSKKPHKISIRDIEINPINYWTEDTENIFKKVINNNTFEKIKYTRNGENNINKNVLVLNQIDWRIDPILDYKKNIEQNNFYYISTDKDMRDLYTFFKSPLYKFINITSKTSKYRKNPKYINIEKILTNTEKITDDEIFKIYDINKYEQDLIINYLSKSKLNKETKLNNSVNNSSNKSKKKKVIKLKTSCTPKRYPEPPCKEGYEEKPKGSSICCHKKTQKKPTARRTKKNN